MVNERVNELVKKYLVLEQKKNAATVNIDGEILKYQSKLQQLQQAKAEATEKFTAKQSLIETEVKEFMETFEDKSYDAGMGKVTSRLTESVFCTDEKSVAEKLKDTEFVRTKIELDKNKIKAEMDSITMKKHGIEITKNLLITIKGK